MIAPRSQGTIVSQGFRDTGGFLMCSRAYRAAARILHSEAIIVLTATTRLQGTQSDRGIFEGGNRRKEGVRRGSEGFQNGEI